VQGTLDLDRSVRIYDTRRGLGAVVDIGAYELIPPPRGSVFLVR
jgi:hypothetical protein